MKNFPPSTGSQTQAQKSSDDSRRRGERGFTTLGVLIVFSILIAVGGLMFTGVTQAARTERRDDDKQNEYWRANGNAETLESQLTHDLPSFYEQDLRAARNIAGVRPLPAFDASETNAVSRPLYRDGQQFTEPSLATSLLGKLDDYVASKMATIQSNAVEKGIDPETTSVAEVKEALRRESVGAANVGRSEAYVVKYQIHANYGLGGRVQPSGTIQLGNTGAGCTISVISSASPAVIRRGQTARLTVNYSATDRIEIKSGATTVATQNVSFDERVQQIQVDVTPSATTTYDTQAFSGNCQANAAPATVTVEWNDAAFVNQSVPNQVEAGSITAVSVTMRNTGTTTWAPGRYFLGTNGASPWGVTRVPVPRNVAPNEVVTFNFNITAPAACPSSGPFQWQMVEETVEWFGELTPAAAIAINCPPPRYEGVFESANCTQLVGWVYNAVKPDEPVTVKVYLDGSFYGQVIASQFRADLQAAGKGNGQHGFTIPTPASLLDGFPHAINITTSDDAFTLASSPRSITCGSRLEGSLEIADCTAFSGWGWDRNDPNATLNIALFADGVALGISPAGIFRPDLLATGIGNGQHGFSFPTPGGLRDGRNHSISAYFSGTSTQLSGSPRVINCPRPDDPCPTVDLTANGQNSIIVDENEDFQLAWSSTDAGTITIDNGIGPVAAPSGSRPFRFAAQGTYTITATAVNPDGSCNAGDSVTVTVRRVADPCPTFSLTANGAKSITVEIGEVFSLAWTSAGATEIVIDNGVGSVPVPSSSRPMSFGSQGTFVITGTAYNNARVCSDDDSVTVTVNPPRPTLAVSLNVNGAKSATVSTNEPATLSYSSTAAAELSIDNGVGPVPVPSGSRPISFAAPGTYRVTLTGFDSGRGNTAQDSVNITVTSRPVPTVSLTANGAKSIAVEENQPFTLAWSSTNAAELSIDNGIGPVDVPSNTRVTRLAAQGQYRITITAWNSDRTASAEDFVDVRVDPPPPMNCPSVTLSISNSPTPGRIRLNYTSVNASALTIDQGVGGVPVPSGNVEINAPATQTTYTITGAPTDGRCAPATASATYTPPPSVDRSYWVRNEVTVTRSNWYLNGFTFTRADGSLWYDFSTGGMSNHPTATSWIDTTFTYRVILSRDGVPFLERTDTDVHTPSVPFSPPNRAELTAAQVPAGNSPVHIWAEVTVTTRDQFYTSVAHITVDSSKPDGTKFPGDSPPPSPVFGRMASIGECNGDIQDACTNQKVYVDHPLLTP